MSRSTVLRIAYALLTLSVLLLDQATKAMVASRMTLFSSAPVVPGLFHITLVRNKGALFGLFCYATFDLTSLALLKNWSWAVAAVDVSWGALVTAVSSTAGLVVANWLVPRG